MNERDKVHTTQLYLSDDEDIMQEQLRYVEAQNHFNASSALDQEARSKMLSEMFAEIGQDCYIEPPLHANWGGHHVHFGDGVYANFGLTLVDDTHIYVGNHVMFGPNVTIITAAHPVQPDFRLRHVQYNVSVTIGNNCWLGAGAIILPGVTIGDNSVIGAGAVVTHDIPANVVAVGNPCRVLREIGEQDDSYYFKEKQIQPEDWDYIGGHPE